MASLAELNAQLEAQRAYFASDERIRDRAAIWRDKTAEECLAAGVEECELVARSLDAMQPDQRERLLAPRPLPPDTIAILEALQRR